MNCSCLCGGGCPTSDWTALPTTREPVRGCPRPPKYNFMYQVLSLQEMIRESPVPQIILVHEVLCDECVAWRRMTPRYDNDRMTIATLPRGLTHGPD